MASTREIAQRQITDKKIREQELGKPSLKSRLIEYAKGSHNITVNKSGRGMEATIAKEKEATKLARLLSARRINGERLKTKLKRKKTKPIKERKRFLNQK